MKKMDKRFGIWTAISMVIGIMIGSGVFIKGGKILSLTDGNMPKAILVIGIVGAICIICSLVFATLGSKYENVNGIVDYAEIALGKKYAYYIGWFLTTIYSPAVASVLAFFSAVMFCTLLGIPSFDFATGSINPAAVGLGAGFLIIGYGINAISPRIAGKLQVGSTVIKLVPLLLMGIIGTIVGLANGSTQNVLNYVNTSGTSTSFFEAIVGFAFAYEGWILATSINSELKDAKKTLPIALIVGSVVVTLIYMLYIFSMSSLGDVDLITSTWPFGETLPGIAFTNIFSKPFGTIIYVFVTISCLGTLNGVIMASSRSLYSLSVRGMGPAPEFFGDVDDQNNFSIKSALFGLICGGFWYAWTTFMWMQGPDFMGNIHSNEWLAWEPDEIVIICLYMMYIPIMIGLMVKGKEFGFFKRFVLPTLGLLCCIFFCIACYLGKGLKQCLGFLVFFFLVEFIGYLLRDKKIKIK